MPQERSFALLVMCSLLAFSQVRLSHAELIRTDWTKYFYPTTQCDLPSADAEFVKADSEGNSVFAGYSIGDSTGPLCSFNIIGRITKHGPDGKFLWKYLIGVQNVLPGDPLPRTVITDLLIDRNDNVIIAIQTNETPDGPHPTQRFSYVIKYSPHGDKQWQLPTGSSPWTRIAGVDASGNLLTKSSSYLGNAVAKISPEGSLLWSKDIYGSALFRVVRDGSFAVVGGIGERSMWIARYDSAGSRLWQQLLPYGAYDGQEDSTLVIDNSGNIIIAGYTWLFKYNQSGALLLQKKLASKTQEKYVSGVATDGKGNIIVSGQTSVGSAQWDLFASKYLPNGKISWTTTVGTPEIERAKFLRALPSGDVVIAGTTEVPPIGYREGYIVKLSAQGSVKWKTGIRNKGKENFDLQSIAVRGNKQIFLSGFWSKWDGTGQVGQGWGTRLVSEP